MEAAADGTKTASKLERDLAKCKVQTDFIKFAQAQGASVRRKRHWVVHHPCGARSVLSSTPKKHTAKKIRSLVLKEFRSIYLFGGTAHRGKVRS